MQWSNRFDRDRPNRQISERDNHNRAVILNAAAMLAICIALASFMPRALFTAALSSITFFAAAGALIAAVLYGEHPLAEQLTQFDVGAAFLLLSIILSWTVDPEALRTYVETPAQAFGPPALTTER